MDDKTQIEQLYLYLYEAMVNKDEAELDRVHDDTFILLHMTGMHQNKKEYIRAIMSGVLNYYSSEKESLDIRINGEDARVIGRSRVTAAVFGGGRHIWRLELTFDLKKRPDGWKFVRAEASTW